LLQLEQELAVQEEQDEDEELLLNFSPLLCANTLIFFYLAGLAGRTAHLFTRAPDQLLKLLTALIAYILK
jgi:hypothetical protein